MHHTGRQVVFYDQLGCGGSDHPGAGTAWSLELFIEELRAVRAAAGLERCHVLGHGWGGMLALEYALSGPKGWRAWCCPARWPASRSGAGSSRGLEALAGGGARTAGGTPSGHHGLGPGQPPWWMRSCAATCAASIPGPNAWSAASRGRAIPEAVALCSAPSELLPGGALAGWDVSARLAEIRCPTLVVSGRYDLVPPAMAAVLYQGIPELGMGGLRAQRPRAASRGTAALPRGARRIPEQGRGRHRRPRELELQARCPSAPVQSGCFFG
jgi:pimeloyl-ACP methyl ester carboxylesterase